MKPFTILNNEFEASSGQKVSVSLYFGVKGVDKTNDNQWESKYTNPPIWDDSFTVKPKKNQQFMYDLCKDLKD